MNTDQTVMVSESHLSHCFKQISWSAILAGALVGLGLTFLLNLFCVAIGLSVITTSQNGATALAVGGFIGLLISTIVAMFVAGMTAGSLVNPFYFKRHLGILYGFTTWAVTLVLTVILATYMTRFVTSYTDYIYNRPAVVNFVNNDTSPAITGTEHSNPSEVTVNTQKAVNNLGYTAFLVFVLFFVGALSSCFGGHCSMACKRKDEDMECDDALRKKRRLS